MIGEEGRIFLALAEHTHCQNTGQVYFQQMKLIEGAEGTRPLYLGEGEKKNKKPHTFEPKFLLCKLVHFSQKPERSSYWASNFETIFTLSCIQQMFEHLLYALLCRCVELFKKSSG